MSASRHWRRRRSQQQQQTRPHPSTITRLRQQQLRRRQQRRDFVRSVECRETDQEIQVCRRLERNSELIQNPNFHRYKQVKYEAHMHGQFGRIKIVPRYQCDQIWRNFATLVQF